MNNSMKILPLVRAFSKSAVTKSASSKQLRLKEIQKKFGIDDGTPVHVKGGFGDRILYQITAALVLGGVAWGGHLCYTLAYDIKE